MTTFVFPFLFMEYQRNDSGFRRKGLIPLVVLSVVIGGVIVTAVMMTWPFILGDKAIPGTVSGDLASDPASIVLLLFFIISGMSWCLSIVMSMMLGGFKYAMWLLLPYLGSVFFFTFGGIKVFENPPNGGSTMFWAATALAGLAVLTVLAAMRNIIDKTKPPMSAAGTECGPPAVHGGSPTPRADQRKSSAGHRCSAAVATARNSGVCSPHGPTIRRSHLAITASSLEPQARPAAAPSISPAAVSRRSSIGDSTV